MTNSVTLETNIVTLRSSNTVNELKEDIRNANELALLAEMPYARDAGFLSAKCCLPGTREGLITEILDWVNSNGPEKLLLLLGQAGTGKSAVAHTISQLFDKQNRLGSLFCFSRSYKDTRNLLFSTISRQLADGDIQWRKSLVPIIQKTSIRTSMDTFTQFEELIIKPSKTVNTIGPVVIIIDGLDESGDRSERAVLLELLFKRCSEFPQNFRFIVTSRPESDVEEWCEHPNVFCKLMADIGLDETTKDIQRYISSRLFHVGNTLDDELDVDWRMRLANRAEGLFQWASTVCNVIDPTVRFGVTERVKTFISGPTSSLYQLYLQIFTNQPEFDYADYLPAFKRVVGAIIIMHEPLSIQALQSLLQDDTHHTAKSIIQPLHSLFLGARDLHTPVRPLHTSLTDFLTTSSIDIVDNGQKIKTIVNPFYIDISDQAYFTLACLKLMNDGEHGLRFNICNLETSHIPNQNVPDLDKRIQVAIPSQLSYACYFWATHLRQSNPSENLFEQLRLLIRTKLLYLFEAFSLLQNVEQVCISMKILADWCEGMDNELAEQAEDACQFGYEFGHVMMKSTPHLYLSALPFAPHDSFIQKQFFDSFTNRLKIELG
ncbi:hypothetical protein Clacol_006923 [Clathrus columnatus]|uniref:NACHT domain-containing protein n=1 Tax=Clathrus columnatus TaxID=1419009 RepID=A0AAV5AHQ7_9AGAM|nr:hypothetical protein Clacol_006923 [Clathrus columnatus]